MHSAKIKNIDSTSGDGFSACISQMASFSLFSEKYSASSVIRTSAPQLSEGKISQAIIYIWLGWWPNQKNKLLREVNAITGSAHSRDKKLALETALNYVKGT